MTTELAATRQRTEMILRLVADSLGSEHSRRVYEKPLTDFLEWHAEQGRPTLSQVLVQAYEASLQERGPAASTVNLRLCAVRRLVAEPADNTLLDRALANGIKAVKAVTRAGMRAATG